jgi:hypothetical protein
MRILFRILLAILAGLSVALLGYYAYTIATDTFSFPFVGQERQQGKTLRFAVARPSFLMHSSTGVVLDADAILASLQRDGVNWNPTVSSEGRISVSGEFVEVAMYQAKKDTRLHIDADTYNSLKNTSYKLPHSLNLVNTETPRNLSISQAGLPRDRTFSLEMYGYEGLSVSDVRWYIHTDASRGCDIHDAWDSRVFHLLSVAEITRDTVGQIEKANYRLNYDSTLPRVCIIA